MERLLGQRLVTDKVVTEEQLAKALDRQRLHGGRLGDNLMALGFATAEELKSFFGKAPRSPRTVGETGLDLSFISDLVMKHILFMGDFTLKDVSDGIMLPIELVDSAIETLRREQMVEVKGAAGYARETYRFSITGPGKKRASELFDICQYVGPAPVTLEEYNRFIECQTVKNITVTEEGVRQAFSEIVAGENLLKRLGPAINSAKAMFIYGPPGNGKTTIAETIGRVLAETVYVPHSIVVGGQIIRVFDMVNHEPIAGKESVEADRRWVRIKRPVIKTGGELTLRMLDLDFNPVSKFYEAPLQMKANNGLFIVDDFGRQMIEPHMLLNRWIVPLDRRTDFLSLHTGMKFDVPFDQLVIFSTNLEPKDLVDEAFLRRIRYKIKIDHPTKEEYEAIFRKVCANNGIAFEAEIMDYLLTEYYTKMGVRLNACHPRDIVDQIIDNAHYYKQARRLTREGIDIAWQNYFVEM